MNNVTSQYQQVYKAQQAIVFFRHQTETAKFYIEGYDIDPASGRPRNAHPLSEQEIGHLAEALNTASEKKTQFLQPKGLLPTTVLYVKQGTDANAVWHTPATTQNLFFRDDLTIPNGRASVPALLWKATKTELQIFALTTDKRPTEKTALYYAPFFNTSQDGRVCMGNVKRDFSKNTSLEEFMSAWQHHFFNSYFSHLTGMNPVEGNIVQMWQGLIGTDTPFDTARLKKSSKTLKTLLP